MDKPFRECLREKMLACGLSAAELSRRSGITKQNIGRILNNTPHSITGALPKVERETVIKLAEPLDWNTDDALEAAGFARSTPTNAAEFVAALERMGVEGINTLGGIENLTPDEYKNLLHDVSVTVEVSLRRAHSADPE